MLLEADSPGCGLEGAAVELSFTAPRAGTFLVEASRGNAARRARGSYQLLASTALPPLDDIDRDGLINAADPDADGDGLPDSLEIDLYLNPRFAGDALSDLDGDGFSNLSEAQANSNLADARSLPATDGAVRLAASILPQIRSTRVDRTVTAFATLINGTTTDATGCRFAPTTSAPVAFSFQATQASDNSTVGSVNEARSIAAGAAQSFVFSVTALAPLDQAIEFGFRCDNSNAAPVFDNVNVFGLKAANWPSLDIVALAATATQDGIVELMDSGSIWQGAFAVATVNVGDAGVLSARVRATNLDLDAVLCESDPVTAVCLAPPGP